MACGIASDKGVPEEKSWAPFLFGEERRRRTKSKGGLFSMSYSKANASPATLTRNRVSPAPQSGICVTCLDGCPGPCEIGRSALRGREILYPQPFSKVTAGAEKDYPID